MTKSTPKSLAITLAFCILIIGIAVAYWFVAALASWGGPEDDIVIVYILAAPILIHGFLISRQGFRRALISSLILFAVVAIWCIARNIEISNRNGYSEWHARRSLEALVWSIPWFAASLLFAFLQKNPMTADQ